MIRYILIFLLVSCAEIQTPSKQVMKQTVEIKETITTTFEIYY
jgi:hypothetical protein